MALGVDGQGSGKQEFSSLMREVAFGETGVEEFGMHEWGYAVTRLYGDPELFRSVGQFRGAIRLVPADGASRPMDLVDATVGNILRGDSNYMVASVDARFGIDVDGSRIDWLAHVNEHGRVGAFEVFPFGAATVRDAAEMVHLMLERLVIRYAVASGIALRWDAFVVEEVSSAPRLVSFRVAYPVVRLNEPFAFGGSLEIVDAFGRLIVEALRTESPFYRALCYYNVARYYHKLLAGKLCGVRRERKLPIPLQRRLPDEHPYATLAMNAVGKTYIELIEDIFRDDYRNSIAHFAVGAALRPVDLAAEESASVASLVLKKMAFDAVADVRADLEVLYADGWGPNEFETMVAEIDRKERHR
jgi:hypothetical protein